MIRVLISGANGRMGQEAVLAIKADPAFDLVGVSLKEHDLLAQIKQYKPDVVLDLTTPEVVFKNCQTIIDQNVHPVIGTSGLTLAQIKNLQAQCLQKKLGGIIAPNFSLGVMLMMKMAAMAARYLPDAEIIELHHDKKLDSPSGTALRTAEVIAANRSTKTTFDNAPARGLFHEGVPIHSIRLPGLLAHQRIIFGGTFESLEIKHDSFDRKSFMPGIVLACKQVMELKELVYGLENLLDA
jgi:4-hydroxy-tetrahydrodipicolinate reductase